MQQEIALTTIYGNKFRISAPELATEGIQHPSNTYLIKFEDKGIVIQRDEICKLKRFLEKIAEN